MSCSQTEIININDLSCLLTSIQKGLYESTSYPANPVEEYDPAYPDLYDGKIPLESFELEYNKKLTSFPRDHEAVNLLNQLSHEFQYSKPQNNYDELKLQHSDFNNVETGRHFHDSTNRRFSPYVGINIPTVSSVPRYPREKKRFRSTDTFFPKKNGVDSSPSNTVFVCNIHYEASELDLVYYFEQIGPVMNVKIMEKNQNGQRKRWAFVTYSDVSTAERCISVLNQKVFMDRKLGISFARLTK